MAANPHKAAYIERSYESKFVPIVAGASESQAIDFRNHVMLQVHVPAAWTAADIGFKVSTTVDGTYVPLYNEAGDLLEMILISPSTALVAPPRVAGGYFIKLWSQSAEVNVPQAAERLMEVVMKS